MVLPILLPIVDQLIMRSKYGGDVCMCVYIFSHAISQAYFCSSLANKRCDTSRAAL